MLNRLATLAAAAGVLLSATVAPLALADPVDPAGFDGPPPDTGIVASDEPARVTSPDGWVLEVAAKNETQLPVAPLTTAASSREYLVGGTFSGTVTGNGKTKLNGGTLEAGYQIGCGIELGQVRLSGRIGISTSGSTLAGLLPTGMSVPLSGTIEVRPKAGTVTQVPVDKKTFKAAPVRVTLKDTHIKVDGCVGQSFLRSYAVLTSSTTDTDDIVAYYGVTKSV
ncbi:MspA family porin [Mycolicibacterium phocaicum]|uniref:MspA family porin n=1 Tax=Mycolicibacterium phocaicum TaxID=319706 RepID=UPI001CFA3B37|nr:MspA family porin [Mycolicibacterium phocaicum]UCZ61182.1 MspA family porin [Mycolicibacterium phocaicum]